MLRVTGLCAGYGSIPVLDHVEMTVQPGEAVAVLGSNGMGKTTLMRALMGYLPATSGSIEFDGRDITADPPYRRTRSGFGYMAQGHGVFPRMTVRDQLRYAITAKGRNTGNLTDILDRFPVLTPLLDRTADVLSGGEKQLLAIASCLGTNPRLVLLDEPTEGIQPSLVNAIRDVLDKFKQSQRPVILLAEQNTQFAVSLCERILVMRKGAIAATFDASSVVDAQGHLDEFLLGAR